ncbi:MAG: restriction endonuclease subunit S, partial [Anaerovoracaceae bacterium]
MNKEIKSRIEQIKDGEIPTGYKNRKKKYAPVEWKESRVDEIAPLQRGFDLPSYKVKEGKYPVCCSNGIVGYHNKYAVKGPGVYTGRSGTIGKVFYIEEDFWAHNTSLWVTKFVDTLPKFTFYLFTRIDFSKYNAGSTVPTLNRNDIHSLKVYIPSIKEQEKIAHILTKWQDAITLQEKLIAKLELQKKALMQKLLTPKKGWKLRPLK